MFVLKNETTTTATTNLFNYSRHTTKADFQVGRRQTHVTKTGLQKIKAIWCSLSECKMLQNFRE